MPRSPKSATPLSHRRRIRITARLVVHRVEDARYSDTPVPVWQYRPFSPNTTCRWPRLNRTHRQHAIIETVFADLIDGSLAHMPWAVSAPTPPGYCARRSPTTCYAPPESSPAAATAKPEVNPATHSSTSPPEWPVRNVNRSCTCPATGPGPKSGSRCGTTPSAAALPNPHP